MTRVFSLFLLMTFVCSFAIAQSPQQFAYQAVVRDNNNQILANRTVGMRISILIENINGQSAYTETHKPKSNAHGIIQLNIGGGTMVSGAFSSVPWSSGKIFVKTEMDLQGGSNYTTSGTTQLLSVPYAMHAITADTAKNVNNEKDPRFESSTAKGITGSDTARWNAKQNMLMAGTGISIIGNTISSINSSNVFNRSIGEKYGGGIVFHVWRDSTGQERGLVVSLRNQSDDHEWSNVQSNSVGPSAQSLWDGLGNSNAIVSQPGHIKSGAKLCLDLVSEGYSDWYLPSISELRILYNNIFNVNRTLSKVQGATELSTTLNNNYYHYWSSTVFPVDIDGGEEATTISFYNGVQWPFSKDGKDLNQQFPVRAIRMF